MRRPVSEPDPARAHPARAFLAALLYLVKADELAPTDLHLRHEPLRPQSPPPIVYTLAELPRPVHHRKEV